MGTLWEDVRADFPALAQNVYLNAAAGSPIPRPVREAAEGFYRQQEEDGDTRWAEWMERREAVRTKVARLVGAEADEIAFVPNTSTGINFIVDLLGGRGAVLSHELEFPTVTLPWIHRGIPVHFVPAVEGVVRIESFAMADAPKAATIALSHVQFSNGCRQDLAAFGGIKGNRSLVVSGSQGVGAFPVDVKAAGVDALASAGHKWLCAGYGTGFLYVSREILAKHPPRTMGWMSVERPFRFNNAQYTLVDKGRRVEMGCPSFPAIFALGAAVDYILGIGLEAIAARVLELNMYLTFRLEREGFTVLSPGGEHRSGLTLVQLPDPRLVTALLRASHILVTEKPEGVRISTHVYNNEADVDACVAALPKGL